MSPRRIARADCVRASCSARVNRASPLTHSRPWTAMVVMRVVVPRLTRGMSPARPIALRQSLMEIFAGIVAAAAGGGSSAPLRRRVQHLLGAYLDDLAGSNVTKPSQYAWNQGQQIRVPVSFRNHYHDGDREPSHVLLEREVPIDRKKHVEVTLRQREQVAVLLAGPTHFRDRSSRVPDQVPL